MSLLVWMPLKGDLKNHGSGTVTTSGTPAYRNDGVDGKQCLNMYNKITCNCANLNGCKKFSIAFWVKIVDDSNITTNWQDVIAFTDVKSDGNSTGSLRAETCYANASYTGVHWHNNATYATLAGSSPIHYNGDRGIWHHCAITIDTNNECKAYTDGVLLGTWTESSGGYLHGNFYFGENNLIQGGLSDVMVWDEVISPEVVKGISTVLTSHHLQTWIPGNNDCRDQGLLKTEWINDNVTIVDGGKLGKCMSFNGSTSRLSTINYSLPNKWTIAAWVKEDATVTAWHGVISLNNNGSDADQQTAIYLKSNETRLQLSYNGTYNSGIPYTPGVWNHLCGTYDGSTAKFYINGTLIQTNSNSGNLSRSNLTIGGRSTSANGAHTSFGNPFKGLMNDIRIYDGPLNAEQVKKLAQGLALHYRLDGYGNTNLVSSFDTSFLSYEDGTISLFTNQMNGGTQEILSNIYGVDKCLHLHCNSGGTGRQFVTMPLTAGKAYTISLDYYSTSTHNSALHGELNGGNYSWLIIGTSYSTPGKWKRLSITYDALTSDTTLYIMVYCATNQDCYVKNIKVEEGSVATPWIPNISHSLSTIMGLNDNVEYDISGFNNNGTKNAITISAPSPKYDSCYSFNGSSSYVKVDNNNWMAQYAEAMTINVWAYSDNWVNVGRRPYSCTESGGFNLEGGTTNCLQFSHYVATNVDRTSHGYQYNNAAIRLSELTAGWHMITVVYTLVGEKIYIDGVLHSEKTVTSYGLRFNTAARFYLGCEANTANPSSPYYNGKFSDFRLYYTALSSDDIVALYQSGEVPA